MPSRTLLEAGTDGWEEETDPSTRNKTESLANASQLGKAGDDWFSTG